MCLGRFIGLGVRLDDSSELRLTSVNVIERTRDYTLIEPRSAPACNGVTKLEPATAIKERFEMCFMRRCANAERSEEQAIQSRQKQIPSSETPRCHHSLQRSWILTWNPHFAQPLWPGHPGDFNLPCGGDWQDGSRAFSYTGTTAGIRFGAAPGTHGYLVLRASEEANVERVSGAANPQIVSA